MSFTACVRAIPLRSGCCMQTHDTTVHRFVVEKSVEQNVHRICSARVAAMDMRGASKAVETPLTVR